MRKDNENKDNENPAENPEENPEENTENPEESTNENAEENPEENAEESEKQKEFYLDSLLDLDGEYEAGEIDKRDYKRLKSAYTKRASRAIKGKPVAIDRKKVPIYKRGAVLLIAFLLVLGSAAGIVIGLTSGDRGVGDEITGDVRSSSQSFLLQGLEAFRLANSFRGSGDTAAAVTLYQEAIDLFNQVLQEDPTNLDAFFARSQAELSIGNSEGARETLTTALAIAQGDDKVEVLALLAQLELGLRSYDAAEARLDEIFALTPPPEVLTVNNISGLEVQIHLFRLLDEYAGIDIAAYPDSFGDRVQVPVPTQYADLGLPSAEVGFNMLPILLPQADNQQNQETRGIPLAVVISDLLVNEAEELFTDETERLNLYLQHGSLFPQVFPPGSANSDKGLASLQSAIDLIGRQVAVLNGISNPSQEQVAELSTLTDLGAAVAQFRTAVVAAGQEAAANPTETTETTPTTP